MCCTHRVESRECKVAVNRNTVVRVSGNLSDRRVSCLMKRAVVVYAVFRVSIVDRIVNTAGGDALNSYRVGRPVELQMAAAAVFFIVVIVEK